MKMKILMCVVVWCWVAGVQAADSPDLQLDRVTLALERLMAIPEQEIPRDFLQRCAAIGVFPGMVKAGFIIGVRFGSGVIIARDARTGRWSLPARFRSRALNLGFQVGGEAIDMVVVLLNPDGLAGLLASRSSLGADLGFALGPWGRRTATATDGSFTAEFQSYSRARGLFVGLSIEAGWLRHDTRTDAALYGMELSARDLLTNFDTAAPPAAERLRRALRHHAGAVQYPE